LQEQPALVFLFCKDGYAIDTRFKRIGEISIFASNVSNWDKGVQALLP